MYYLFPISCTSSECLFITPRNNEINIVVNISQLEIGTVIIAAPPKTLNVNPAAILKTSNITTLFKV